MAGQLCTNIKTWSRWVMALFYGVAGVNHFRVPEFYESLIPPYLPWPEGLNLLSGLAEIVLAIALIVPNKVLNRWAAWGVIALLVAVFPANLHMLLNPNQFESLAPVGVFWLRIPIQGMLIFWAWWYTRKEIA
jgi:uncharacterized membrane protein